MFGPVYISLLGGEDNLKRSTSMNISPPELRLSTGRVSINISLLRSEDQEETIRLASLRRSNVYSTRPKQFALRRSAMFMLSKRTTYACKFV